MYVSMYVRRYRHTMFLPPVVPATLPTYAGLLLLFITHCNIQRSNSPQELLEGFEREKKGEKKEKTVLISYDIYMGMHPFHRIA